MSMPHTCICETCRREMMPMFIGQSLNGAPCPKTHLFNVNTCASCEVDRLRGFLIEIAGPGTMDEKTFFARQALDTHRVTVHGPQCLCSRCEAQRAVHTR